MKKILSILATSIILVLTFFVVMTSAASKPEAKSVSFAGANADVPLSKQELKTFFEKSDSFNYYSDAMFSQKIKVTLKTGESYTLKSASDKKKVGKYTMTATAVVTKANYEKAIADKSTTVPVSVKVTFKKTSVSNIIDLATKGNTHSNSFTLKKNIVSRYIKSISAVSGLPSSVYKNADATDFDGAVFQVTYYDGAVRKITVAADEPKSDGSVTYSLNEHPIEIAVTKDSITAKYFDSPTYKKTVTVLDSPFKSVKITNCEFADNKLASVSYTLTTTDDDKETFVYVCEEITTKSKPVPTEIIAVQNDYNVWIKSSDTKGNATNSDQYVICISVGNISTTKIVKTGDVIKKDTDKDSVSVLSVFDKIFAVLGKLLESMLFMLG